MASFAARCMALSANRCVHHQRSVHPLNSYWTRQAIITCISPNGQHMRAILEYKEEVSTCPHQFRDEADEFGNSPGLGRLSSLLRA